ncbi:unnamed protein product [Penicillium discolor]
MVWGKSSAVESTTSTPSAALRKSTTALSEASRLCRASATAAAFSPASSPARRAARTSGAAVSRMRTGASGATTVVMSRPSTTTAGYGASATSARKSSLTWVRTSGTRATPLTAPDTRGSRIASVTSTSPTRTVRSSGSSPRRTGKSAAAARTASASSVSAPRSSTCQASARVQQASLVGGDGPVLQLDALRELRDGLRRHAPLDLRDVNLGDAEGGVREDVREFAVVCEQQQTAGLGVQAADVVQPLVVVLCEAPEVRTAALIAHAADHAGRLVQHHVALGHVELHRGAVDVDQVAFRVDAATEFGDRLAVHADASLDDVLLDDASRGDAGGRQHLLQSHAFGSGGIVGVGGHRTVPSSKPSAPSSRSGEIGGSSSRELMPRCWRSASVVP